MNKLYFLHLTDLTELILKKPVNTCKIMKSYLQKAQEIQEAKVK